jgi:hypothetical protein
MRTASVQLAFRPLQRHESGSKVTRKLAGENCEYGPRNLPLSHLAVGNSSELTFYRHSGPSSGNAPVTRLKTAGAVTKPAKLCSLKPFEHWAWDSAVFFGRHISGFALTQPMKLLGRVFAKDLSGLPANDLARQL